MSDFETWLGNQLDARLDDYEEGKSVGYASGYQQGRTDERERIIKELEGCLHTIVGTDTAEAYNAGIDTAIEIVRGERNEKS